MIKYWEFELHHVDGSREYINPVLCFSPVGDVITVYNGYHDYQYSLSEIREWKLTPVYEEKEDE